MYLVVCGVLLCLGFARAQQEANLQESLLQNYKAKQGIRPVQNYSDALNVHLGMALVEVLNFDTEDTGTLEVKTWLRFLWHDDYLRWDPSEFDGIDYTRVSVESIWRPDVILYNNIDVREDRSNSLSVVSSDGTVLWIPAAKLKVTCNEYPYEGFEGEVWRCNFKFGSWTFDGFSMDMNLYDGLEEIDLSDWTVHTPHEEWTVLENTATKNVRYYACCEEPYPDVMFTLTLGRNASSSDSDSDSSD